MWPYMGGADRRSGGKFTGAAQPSPPYWSVLAGTRGFFFKKLQALPLPLGFDSMGRWWGTLIPKAMQSQAGTMTLKMAAGDRPVDWKYLLLGAGLAVGTSGLGAAAPAVANDAVQQLLETNACVGCDLAEADLRRYDLSGADLNGADLTGVNFYRTNLSGADLSGADLNHAYLGDANFQGANLNSANLDNTNLIRTDFTGAELYGTHFGEAYLEDTLFIGAFMPFADLSRVIYTSANFEGADLCGALIDFGDYRYQCVD
jgi:hypothetical protein